MLRAPSANWILASALAGILCLPACLAAQVRVQTGEAAHSGGATGAAGTISAVRSPLSVDLNNLSLGAAPGLSTLQDLSVAPAVTGHLIAAKAMTLSPAATAASGLVPTLDPVLHQPAAAPRISAAPTADGSPAALAKAMADPKVAAANLARLFDNSRLVADKDLAETATPAPAAEYAQAATARLTALQQKVARFKSGDFGLGLTFNSSSEGSLDCDFAFTYNGQPLSVEKIHAMLASGRISKSQWDKVQTTLRKAVKDFTRQLKAVLKKNQAEKQAAEEKLQDEAGAEEESLEGLPPQAVAMHKAWEAQADRRLDEIDAEIESFKLGRFGYMVRQDDHEDGSYVLSYVITYKGQPLNTKKLQSLIKSGSLSQAQWQEIKRAIDAVAPAAVRKVKAAIDQNDLEHEAVHRRMMGSVRGVYRTVDHEESAQAAQLAAPNLTDAHLERLYDKMFEVERARLGQPDAKEEDLTIPQEDALRLTAVLKRIDSDYAYPIVGEAWDKAVEVMAKAAAEAFGLIKAEVQAGPVAQAAEAAAKAAAGQEEPAQENLNPRVAPADMTWDLAVTAMLKAAVKELLDSYGAYWNQAEFKQFKYEDHANFVGIGIMHDKDSVILHVYPNSPASKAGLQDGDKIVGVDGKKVADMKDVSGLRGKEGTSVRVQVERGGQVLPDFTIVRAEVHSPNVQSRMVAPGIGYFMLDQFTSGSAEEVFAAVKELREQGAKKLIWDLRENPGGDLDDASAILAAFFKDGQRIVSYKRQGQLLSENFADGDGVYSDMPIVVLMNNGSASASEVSAGALQDVRGAVVVGSQSYGKGILQTVQGDKQGRGMRLTHALWHTPKDRNIDGQRDPKTKAMIEHTGGITPDYPVALSEEQETAVMQQVMDDFIGIDRKKPRIADPVLEKALEVLSK